MDPNIRVEWGENLANYRGETPQPEFAEELGITQGQLSRIERGLVKVTDDMKWLICGRLKVPVNVIFPVPRVIPPMVTDIEPLPVVDRRRTPKPKRGKAA